MSISLVSVRNPKWKTAKQIRLDADGNPVYEADGKTYISDVINDSDGNPIDISGYTARMDLRATPGADTSYLTLSSSLSISDSCFSKYQYKFVNS